MGARVAVAGASGYAGGELLRLLAGHPDLELAVVTADSNAGRSIAALHPHLASVPSLASRTFDAADGTSLSGCDLAFLALPAGQSAELAGRIPDEVKIVDLGPDFRLADASAWARHYGGDHAGWWTCGLPELPAARERIRAARRVAVPGCYATAAILALTPLLAAGLGEPDDVVIVAASGTSGAGRVLRQELLASEVIGAVSAYQAGGAHRHTPEIEQAIDAAVGHVASGGGGAGSDASGRRASDGDGGGRASGGGAGDERGAGARVSFTPVLAPMSRGILATCTARLAGPAAGAVAAGAGDAGGLADAGRLADAGGLADAGSPATALLRAALAAAYTGEPFVSVLPDGRWPSTAAVAGSNAVHLQAAADARAGRGIVVAAIDNLGKGAAGQAVQNANLMLGLPETAGLSACGLAP